MTTYLITVLLLHTAAWLIYELLLKKTTFLRGNRAYLLLVPVVLWFVPFINIEALNPSPVVEQSVYQTAPILFEPQESSAVFEKTMITEPSITAPEPAITFSWWWIYATGVVVSLMLFLRNYFKLNRIASQGLKNTHNGIHYYLIPDSTIALSFMGKILIGSEVKSTSLKTIVAHEQVHITQKHHLDLLFFQLLNIILWFNLFNYIFLNRLKLTHELLADRAIAHELGVTNYTDLLLNETFTSSSVPFANMFLDVKTLKTRITMLYKKSTPKISRLRYASIFIVLLSTVIYTSCTTFKKEEPTLEQQISELNHRLKELDSISLKDLNSLDSLQMAVSSYYIDDNNEYAIFDKEYDEAAYREYISSPEGLIMKARLDSVNSLIRSGQIVNDTLYFETNSKEITNKEFMNMIKWLGRNKNKTSGAAISKEGKNIIHTFNFKDEFELPLYSNFKAGKKTYFME